MQTSLILSNVNVYLDIANEALRKAQRLEKKQRRPRGDGGFVITVDPKRTCFKQSLIAIVFAGIYFEALLYIEAKRRFSPAKLEEFDRPKKGRRLNYEKKLQLLGLSEPNLLADCTRFRESRNDLVHEKALELVSGTVGERLRLRTAQEEAAHGVAFVKQVTKLLQSERDQGC